MTISSSADDDPRKGIAELTSLGKTKKKGDPPRKTGVDTSGESKKFGATGEAKVIAANDARFPVDLNVSLDPLNDPIIPVQDPFSAYKNKTLLRKKSRESAKKKVLLALSNKETSQKIALPDKEKTPHDEQMILRDQNNSTNSTLGAEVCQSGDTFKKIAPTSPKQIPESFNSIPESTNEKARLSYESPTEDFSLRSDLLSERVRFEIILPDNSNAVDVRTKALLVFAKFVNLDPSRKIIPYLSEDMQKYPMLDKHHDIPSESEKMSKYVSSPMYNPKGKKLVFYTHFRTTFPLSEMKRDPLFMVWLKEQQIYTSVMTIHTTDNVRVGFFLGKGPHITTVTKFTTWIQERLKKHCTVYPAFPAQRRRNRSVQRHQYQIPGNDLDMLFKGR